jgi:hypothetical protein
MKTMVRTFHNFAQKIPASFDAGRPPVRKEERRKEERPITQLLVAPENVILV